MFDKMFSILDHDLDGEISVESINYLNLPDKTLQVILPILIELEHHDSINRVEFVGACERLYKVSTPPVLNLS